MRIPPEKIDEIRNATGILDIIGAFVKLKKRGKNYVGLCPFHSEKTPSFTVSHEKQMYHCFGCGVGGNVFTFVMEYEKVSFAEAVRTLAEKAGITIPQSTPEQEAVVGEHEQLYEICRMAGMYFHTNLTETTEGKLALEYFHHRGFTDETIRTFGLGFSANSWDGFLKYATEKKYSPDLLEKAGLIRKRDDTRPNPDEVGRRGTYYDYFRGRAMFPIFSTTGRVIGFGARKLLEDDPLGKYINSPETPIYSKSKTLYGIFQTKEDIRATENTILVEGYVDLISVYQAGIKNVVATSGTALTQEQISLISRYAKTVTIVYDADSAGSKAALRGVDLILENDLDVRVAVLPEGEDPDSFVKKFGGEKFRTLIDGALSFIDFIAQAYEKEGKFTTPEGQAQVVRAIVQIIAKMRDELKRNFYIKYVSEKYKLYESTLYRELEKHLGEERKQRREEIPPQINPMVQTDTISNREISPIEIPPAERDLIHAMLEGKEEIIRFIFNHLLIDDFTHPSAKDLTAALLERMEEGVPLDPTTLLDEIQDPIQKRLITEVMLSKYQLSKGWDETKVYIEQANPRKIAADALLILKRRALEKQIAENQNYLRETSTRGENVIPFMERHRQLLDEIKELEIKGVFEESKSP